MPSPFPGMDPYLEKPSLWPDVHHSLISQIRAALNRVIRPKYVARVEERVYISDEDDPGRSVIIPDVHFALRQRPATPVAPANVVSTLEPIVITELIDSEIHEARVELVDAASREVVTVIEVISPTNKAPGARGREGFLAKRQAVLRSDSHWMEIDLLRAGEPLFGRGCVPPCEYLVYLSRADDRPRHRVWPLRLKERLPVIGVPLRGADPVAPLDLQAVLNAVYDEAGY